LQKFHRRRFSYILFVLVLGLAGWSRPVESSQKLKADELLDKHLNAIGSAEARKSVESLIILGTVVATFRSPGTGQIAGRAVLSSQGDKNVLGMVFDNMPDYPHEKFGFDGRGVSIRRSTTILLPPYPCEADEFATHRTRFRPAHGACTPSAAGVGMPSWGAGQVKDSREPAVIQRRPRRHVPDPRHFGCNVWLRRMRTITLDVNHATR
jgi:hypothetical protein